MRQILHTQLIVQGFCDDSSTRWTVFGSDNSFSIRAQCSKIIRGENNSMVCVDSPISFFHLFCFVERLFIFLRLSSSVEILAQPATLIVPLSFSKDGDLLSLERIQAVKNRRESHTIVCCCPVSPPCSSGIIQTCFIDQKAPQKEQFVNNSILSNPINGKTVNSALMKVSASETLFDWLGREQLRSYH